MLLRIPHQRVICCHSSGSLAFGPDGNLYISTGDDTEHAASNGFAPLDDRLHAEVASDNPDAKHAFDSRRSSGNTNDLRGKILRITPKDDGTYTIPAGNLFPPFSSDPAKTRPEIYTMGHRNPFRIHVDPETGWLYNGEVGPDANADNAGRGPRGYDELNQIRSAGNMGWPFCIANNKAYVRLDVAERPVRRGVRLRRRPGQRLRLEHGPGAGAAGRPAMLYWPYGASPDFPQIPTGPGRTAIAGPTYHYDAAARPRSSSRAGTTTRCSSPTGRATGSRRSSSTSRATRRRTASPSSCRTPTSGTSRTWRSGADGALYVLEWGRDFNYAGSGINPDSGLYRIEYAKGNRTPKAKASADKDSGQAPLTVQFSSAGSTDPDGDALTYAGTSATTRRRRPTRARRTPTPGRQLHRAADRDRRGRQDVVLDGDDRGRQHAPGGASSMLPPQGGLYDWGDDIAFTSTVTDPEDGTIDCDKVEVSPGVFHDEGGNAHVHPGVSTTGCNRHDRGRRRVRPRQEREHRARPHRDLHGRGRARLAAAGPARTRTGSARSRCRPSTSAGSRWRRR